MKKNLLVYLFAACCTGSVFTACSSDDDNAAVVFPIDQEIAGKTGCACPRPRTSGIS